jgi:hypothetical protein
VRKILVLSAVSEELDRCWPEAAANVIGRVLADAVSQSIDTTAFDAIPGDVLRPAGLLFGVTPIAASAATDPWNAMCEDIANLVEQIGNAGVDPNETIFIARPREATLLSLRAGPDFNSRVLMSLGLPPKTVVAAAPAGIASGYQGPPAVETSRESLLHMDTAPADIVDDAGTPAAPSQSLFQTNLIGVRVKARAAWCAAPGAVSVVDNVAW